MTIAKHLVDDCERDVEAARAPLPLPMTSSWMRTGVYSYAGGVYDCSEEGLYLFWDDATGTAQNRMRGLTSRAGPSASTMRFNGVYNGRRFGGTLGTVFSVEEVVS